MPGLSILERNELKLKLTKKIAEFTTEAFEGDQNVGWMPTDIESLMADAAFAVLEAVAATNAFMSQEGLLQE